MSSLHRFVFGCRACDREVVGGCGGRHWRVDGYGWSERIVVASSAAAARWKDFDAQVQAGYRERRDFRGFLNASGTVSEVRT